MTINLTCTIENLHSELSDLFGDDLTHSKLLAINRVCQMANMGYHGNFESHQAQKKLGVKVTLVPTSPTSEPFDPEVHAARRHHNAVHPSQHLTRKSQEASRRPFAAAALIDAVAVDNATDPAEVDPYPEGRYTVADDGSSESLGLTIFDHKADEFLHLDNPAELQWICDRLNESGADR